MKIYDPQEYLDYLVAGNPVIYNALILAQPEWYQDGNLEKPFGMYAWFEDYFSKLNVMQLVVRSVVWDDLHQNAYMVTAERVLDPMTRIDRHAGMPQTVKIKAQCGKNLTALVARDHIRISSDKMSAVAVYRKVLDQNGDPEWFTEVETIRVDRHKEFVRRTPAELVTAIQSLAVECDELHFVNLFKDSQMKGGISHRWNLVCAVKEQTNLPLVSELIQYGTTGATKLGAMRRRVMQHNSFTTPVVFHNHYQAFLSAYEEFCKVNMFERSRFSQVIAECNGDSAAFMLKYFDEYLKYLQRVEAFYERWIAGTTAIVSTILMFNE